MSRKIKELKKGDTIIFQKQACDASYLGVVIEISEDRTKAVVEIENLKRISIIVLRYSKYIEYSDFITSIDRR
ncbi:hypothetical protein [Staphylococcus xylosus]|uniref:hypothetical protein n=1 Tax=Staphylococcus xylosus TaxID=1288 RepID=UPI000D1D4F1E|nr:hypothetical protein [Staphylococcus xylosus]PTI64193.1 hypothetical protein BU095_06245 [Staphylococcus xylosus]